MNGKIALAVLAVVIAFASVAVAADFRGNNWGDSPDQVRAVEGKGELEYTADGTACLFYYVDLAGQADVEAAFFFTAAGRLAEGRYVPPVYGFEPFREWENILTGKYGEPKIADAIYSDNDFIKDNYYHGGWRDIEFGVSRGHFNLGRYWSAKGTLIHLILAREDDEAAAELYYFSTEYGVELNAELEAADREGF